MRTIIPNPICTKLNPKGMKIHCHKSIIVASVNKAPNTPIKKIVNKAQEKIPTITLRIMVAAFPKCFSGMIHAITENHPSKIRSMINSNGRKKISSKQHPK